MHTRAQSLVAATLVFVVAFASIQSNARAETTTLRPWNDYRTIMWVGDSARRQPDKYPLFFKRLREMGINTAMVYGDSDPQVLIDNRFDYYVENMINRGLCLKFSSKVTDWNKFVTDWAKTGRPDSALARDYCLDDTEWQGWARREAQQIAKRNREHHPLAYNIRDELSTTISANPFDYDFSPAALEGFRAWLKTQYAGLAELNAEWETQFEKWEDVKPFTTDGIKNRMSGGGAMPRGKPDWQALQSRSFAPAEARKDPTSWNFSPWADFRSYMDISLARELGKLRDATHEVDPLTPVGIEGTQMPDAFGGYDLWRLSQVLDWVEPYDIGASREIFGSFMPEKPILTTVFESDTNHAKRRLWHLLLEGDRGCIVWWSEDCIDWKSEEYALTPKARALAPVLKEMTAPLAEVFLRAQRERDPVFIHYSQASIQVDWLLESTVDGSTWLRRFSSYESAHNTMARVRRNWLKAMQDLGFDPVFVSTDQIEAGALRGRKAATLVLPTSIALSDKEASEIRAFLGESKAGMPHVMLCDGTPGEFDAHGRLRKAAALDGMALELPAGGRVQAVEGPNLALKMEGDMAVYGAERIKQSQEAGACLDWMRDRMGALKPEFVVTEGRCVRVRRYRVGAARLVAFERNIDYQMSEDLKQAGGNEPLETPEKVTVRLPAAYHAYDLRARKYLGRVAQLNFTLEPWEPSLFALTEEKVPEETIVEYLAAANQAKK